MLDSPNLGPTRPSADNENSNEPQSAFDPDAMDLDSGPSSSASSPPSTPPIDTAHTTSSAFDNTVLRTSRALSKGSISGYNTPRGISPHPHTPGGAAGAPDSMLTGGRGEAAFNPYASYSDFSALMPGTVRTPVHQSPPPLNAIKNGGVSTGGPSSPGANNSAATKCIPPALLFSPSTQTTPTGSPPQSRTGTPTPGTGGSLGRNGSFSGANGGLTSASLMSLANQQASSFGSGMKKSSLMSSSSSAGANGINALMSKPFRCPTAGCNKSYKQANGLKYHITHGQCNFMPRDPALDGLNENEADEKARPYVCQVGSCTRRYKNMNGLREFFACNPTLLLFLGLTVTNCTSCFNCCGYRVPLPT